MALTGNGESGFDSGEAARETATTTKVGSRHANCPMQRHSVRQRRTVSILSAINADGTWNGCYPKTVMSINWRASLVPAAAVIPAPRAYTNIAAVKTLVVCLRAAGLLGGRSLPWLGLLAFGLVGSASVVLDSTPSGMSLRPILPTTVRIAPAKSLLHCRPKRNLPPTLAKDTKGAQPRAGQDHPCPPPEPTVSDTLENSVCSKQPRDG